MRLEYINKRNKVTDDEIVTDILYVAEKLKKHSLTIAEYEQYGNFDPTTVIRHFGSWNKALTRIGLTVTNREYTTQELFDNLAEIWMRIGHQPSRRDLSLMHSPISYKAYERRFGKWSYAVKAFVDYYNSSDGYTFDQIEIKPSPISHKTSRDVNLRMRFIVMSRDNFKCCICGASPAKDPSVELHVDHIVPWAKGGETILDNLQTLCSKCNMGKSDL